MPSHPVATHYTDYDPYNECIPTIPHGYIPHNHVTSYNYDYNPHLNNYTNIAGSVHNNNHLPTGQNLDSRIMYQSSPNRYDNNSMIDSKYGQNITCLELNRTTTGYIDSSFTGGGGGTATAAAAPVTTSEHFRNIQNMCQINKIKEEHIPSKLINL